jgi:MFS family permease
MSGDLDLYIKLSALMALQYAIWGAWYPVLAARLLGPLGFSGKQTGWIYAVIPLGCVFMPLAAGQLADRWVNTELILAGAHLIGAFLLLVAAWRKKFVPLFAVMLVYALCYAATLPLVNSLMFHHLAANEIDLGRSTYIFMWAPIAWAMAGYFLTAWRWVFRTGGQGRDGLILAGALSVVMAVVCSRMPQTPPAKTGEVPLLSAVSMLGDTSFLVFVLISICAAGMMQFYFLGTAQFMQDKGIAAKSVPASMAIAQAVQAVATLFLLGLLVERIGYRGTLTCGAACWLVLFAIYVLPRPRWVIVLAQSFHGLAYVLFIIAGQMLAERLAAEGARASTQALVFTAQSGIGPFLGAHLAGIVMDACKVDGRFKWSRVWMVPALVMTGCVVALIVFFGRVG